ncbi:unnamed protein product [Amoebophrya sp. A25]|nr:unnamed protein product [Amoebophrya sp. A25]|eukprot:GSA25T00000010001.1
MDELRPSAMEEYPLFGREVRDLEAPPDTAFEITEEDLRGLTSADLREIDNFDFTEEDLRAINGGSAVPLLLNPRRSAIAQPGTTVDVSSVDPKRASFSQTNVAQEASAARRSSRPPSTRISTAAAPRISEGARQVLASNEPAASQPRAKSTIITTSSPPKQREVAHHLPCAVCGEPIKGADANEAALIARTSDVLVGVLQYFSRVYFGATDVTDIARKGTMDQVQLEFSDYESDDDDAEERDDFLHYIDSDDGKDGWKPPLARQNYSWYTLAGVMTGTVLLFAVTWIILEMSSVLPDSNVSDGTVKDDGASRSSPADQLNTEAGASNAVAAGGSGTQSGFLSVRDFLAAQFFFHQEM